MREVSVSHAHLSHEDPCIPGQEACHGSHGEILKIPAATWKIGQHGDTYLQSQPFHFGDWDRRLALSSRLT